MLVKVAHGYHHPSILMTSNILAYDPWNVHGRTFVAFVFCLCFSLFFSVAKFNTINKIQMLLGSTPSKLREILNSNVPLTLVRAHSLLDLYISGKTPYRQISWSLEAARLDAMMIVLL